MHTHTIQCTQHRHVRFFNERGACPGLTGKQARPQFPPAGAKPLRNSSSLPFTLQSLLRKGLLGGFINSSRVSGGSGSAGSNVSTVLFEGRQFFISTCHIEVGEEILHTYPELEHHHHAQRDIKLDWFMKGGLDHDLDRLLIAARARASARDSALLQCAAGARV